MREKRGHRETPGAAPCGPGGLTGPLPVPRPVLTPAPAQPVPRGVCSSACRPATRCLSPRGHSPSPVRLCPRGPAERLIHVGGGREGPTQDPPAFRASPKPPSGTSCGRALLPLSRPRGQGPRRPAPRGSRSGAGRARAPSRHPSGQGRLPPWGPLLPCLFLSRSGTSSCHASLRGDASGQGMFSLRIRSTWWALKTPLSGLPAVTTVPGGLEWDPGDSKLAPRLRTRGLGNVREIPCPSRIEKVRLLGPGPPLVCLVLIGLQVSLIGIRGVV